MPLFAANNFNREDCICQLMINQFQELKLNEILSKYPKKHFVSISAEQLSFLGDFYPKENRFSGKSFKYFLYGKTTKREIVENYKRYKQLKSF